MNKPYFRKSKGITQGTYVRSGSHTIQATPEIIETLRWQNRGYCVDEMPVYTATVDNISQHKFELFLKQRT